MYPKIICNFLKITFLILIVTIFFSCKNNSGNNENSQKKSDSAFTIKDDAGIELKFESHPKRIISLAPNITEAIFAISADSMLVGVTDLCDYPPEAKLKTKTGSYITPDYEKILSLKPDLIIMYAENISQPIYQALKNYNLKIFVSNAKNIDGVIKMIRDLGIITGKEGKADAVADSISSLRNEYNNQNSGTTPEKALVVISVNPLMTANKNTFINEIVELSGFENIYKNESIDYPLISYEDVVNKNPDFIILPGDTNNTDNLKKYKTELSEKLNTVNAVKENRFIYADENVLFRPGPRVLDGVKLLRNTLPSKNIIEKQSASNCDSGRFQNLVTTILNIGHLYGYSENAKLRKFELVETNSLMTKGQEFNTNFDFNIKIIDSLELLELKEAGGLLRFLLIEFNNDSSKVHIETKYYGDRMKPLNNAILDLNFNPINCEWKLIKNEFSVN